MKPFLKDIIVPLIIHSSSSVIFLVRIFPKVKLESSKIFELCNGDLVRASLSVLVGYSNSMRTAFNRLYDSVTSNLHDENEDKTRFLVQVMQ
ncbi:1-(5-phosphoribosyl)-5-[(5-phosphoribosylamino)methylideneamino] imidazole-4-carboxamide isomerase [Dirofilaria immitis]